MSDQWIGPLGAGAAGGPQGVTPSGVNVSVGTGNPVVSAGSSGITYQTFEQPFTSTSVWNTPLNANPTYEQVGPFAHQQSMTVYGAGANTAYSYGHPVFEGTGSDPVYTISIGNYEDWEEVYGAGQGFRQVFYNYPVAGFASGGTDGHTAVVNGTDVLEMYQANINDGARTISTGYGVRQDITGDGLQGGTRAYGGCGIAGLVRGWEIAAGVISHRLAFMLPDFCLKSDEGVPWVWPASRRDGESLIYGDASWGARMGDCYAIPKSINLNSLGLSPNGLIYATAAQNFGGHIIDQSAATSISATGWDVAPGDVVSSGDATIIAQNLRRVTSVTEINPGG